MWHRLNRVEELIGIALEYLVDIITLYQYSNVQSSTVIGIIIRIANSKRNYCLIFMLKDVKAEIDA